MTTDIEAEWNHALDEQKKRLSRKKYKGILQQLDYKSFQESLENENQRYGERNIARHLKALTPVLEQLNSFVAAITSLVQASGSIAGFVWGTIQAVIVVASKFVDIMDTVTEMFGDLTKTMTQLNRYIELFPTDLNLRTCFRTLIQDYVGFCITTLKFFKRWSFYTLLRLFWSSVDRDFKKAKENINKHVQEFASQRQLAVDEELVLNNRDLVERHGRIEAVLPTLTITTKAPEKLYLVSYQQNPHFCERDDILSFLHDNLSDPPGTSVRRRRSCVVHGTGGVGKTQVAIEYTYRYRDSYDYIFWIRAETDPELSDGMVMLAKKLHLADAGDASNRAAIEGARTWLENSEKRWLLVFDNVEHSADLKAYWPNSTNGSILMTSQNAEISRMTYSEVPLKPFNHTEGARFLLEQIHGDDDSSEYAESICSELGGLPLAIAHVAGYIWQSKISYKDFLKLLKERSNSARIFNRNAPVFQYDKTLGVVWDIALQKLDQDALKLIQVLSMMNPDGVPEDMLHGNHSEPALSFLKAPDIMRFNDMISNLRTRQLVDREEVNGKSCLLMHRSLQRSILHRLDEDLERLNATFDMCFTLVRKVFPRQSPFQFPQNDIWHQCEQYSSQVMSLVTVYEGSVKPPKPSIEFAEMLSDVSNYFWERNIFGDCLRASDIAEKICEKFPGRFKKQRSDTHSLAGIMRSNYGISERAGTLHRFQKATALRQQYLDEMDPSDITENDIFNYANAWSNVAAPLLDYDCYEDAFLYAEFGMNIKKRLFGDKYLIPCYENLLHKALALAALGQFEEAIGLIPNDADIPPDEVYAVALAVFHFRWANIYLVAGEFESAHAKLMKTLDKRTKTFGPSGRGTLDTYYLLAMLEQKRGNLKKAEDYLRRALERPDEWTDESRARAHYRLGQVLCALNRENEAQEFQDKAQAARDKFWGICGAYLPATLDEDIIYDHIASGEAGRSTMGSFRLPLAKTPMLNEICSMLNDRLLNAGDVVLSPSALSSLLRMNDMPIPIEENFEIVPQ